MTNKRMLVIDIDGTLLDSSMVLRPSARDALERALEAGFHLVFATGRQYRSCHQLVKEIAPGAPVILNSGALIKDTNSDKTLFVQPVEPETALVLADLILSEGFPPVIMMDAFDQGFDFLTTDPVGRTQTHAQFINKNRRFGLMAHDVPKKFPAPVTQILALGERQELEAVHAAARERCGHLVDMRIIRAPQYSHFVFEAYATGISKWDALQHLIRRMRIPVNCIAAIGDDINDLELLRESGLGIAMGNAPEHVKAAADACVASCDNDGFAQAVELILEGVSAD